jgi:hypothetical protein
VFCEQHAALGERRRALTLDGLRREAAVVRIEVGVRIGVLKKLTALQELTVEF